MSAPRTPQWSTQERENLWKICTETFTALTAYLDRCLKEQVEIRLSEFNILAALMDSQKEGKPVLRMGELAQITRVSDSKFTYQAATLVKLGWVNKEAIPGDRRGVGLRITPLGQETYELAAEIYQRELEEIVLDGLSDDLAAAISRFFLNVHERISRQNHTS